jgi:Tfp pilus assembly protein PilF
MEKISQYCQKCRAANQPGDVVCHRCGTRLMLVVIPASVRHEETLVPSYYEDHLLERVSLLELRLGQIAERLSMALDLMLRQAKTTQVDHFLLETLIESLNSLGISEKDALTQKLRERLEGEEAAKETPETRRERAFKNILLNHEQPSADLFAHLVREGIRFLNEGEEKQGFRTLERAAQLSPGNVPLLIFVAESLFRADKFEAAKKYLEKGRELAPQETKILLLSAVIYADEGEAENARQFLSLISNKPETAFCVSYARGFLAAAEEKWMEAAAAFSQALNLRDLPEMHYLVACAYFQLESYKTARKHLEKALALDANFADAWFMQSVIFSLSGEEAKAGEALDRALQAKEAGAECLAFLKRRKDENPRVALPFARLNTTEKHWLTGGARRLTKLFREEIYKIIG